MRLTSITLDTDTTVHTLYGRQMGGRKSYNPKNKGKKSYQPILTFLAETREYIWGELRNGDRPTGQQIARHLQGVFGALPPCIVKIFARADAGFYCGEAVQAYEKGRASFIMVARKTTRLLAELQSARWQPSPRTDADEQCEFCYQPEGWGKAYRFIALRYQKKDPLPEREQYQLFDSSQYIYRVFVTNMKRPIDLLAWFYNQRAGAENLIKEANNDAGLAAHPSGRWATNCVHFQRAMLAYNLNCWLLLFQREETAKVAELKHTTLAIARLRFLFLAAKVWRHAVTFPNSPHYFRENHTRLGSLKKFRVYLRPDQHGGTAEIKSQQLLELAVRAKSGQMIFSKDLRNRIAGFSQLFTDLQPHSSAGVGLMYFLEWNGQE